MAPKPQLRKHRRAAEWELRPFTTILTSMLYVYPFAELHPETYARCLRQPHSIISWHDGQVVGEAALTGDDPGNIWVSLPAEAIDLLRTSGAYFVVTETFVPGDPPTLVVKGEFSPV